MIAREDETTWREERNKKAVEPLVRDLKASLKTSTFLTPDLEGYAESIRRWSDAVERRAVKTLILTIVLCTQADINLQGVVVYVGSAEDISTTVILSRKHSIYFVVSGEKHSSSRASSTEGGLVIDLAKRRKVVVDVPTKTVKVQGGCIWQDVDDAAADHGLAMVGGTVNHTAVGGLTLRGGYGWLSGRYGLTINSLLKVQIVLRDGSIKTTSKDENPDLFWAMRGAGHCFGVVSEFIFQTYEQRNSIWAGQLIFPASTKLDGVVAFANKLLITASGDSGLVMGITVAPFMSEPAVVATVFHNGPKEKAESVFQGLLELQPTKNTAQGLPYREMNGMMNRFVAYGGRKLSKGACFVTPLSPDFYRSLIGDLQQLHQTVPGSNRAILLFEFFHPDTWCEVAQDATAFANRGRHQNLMIGPFWDDAADDQVCRLWARQIAKKSEMELERVKTEAGNLAWMESIGEYGNYDGLLSNARRVFGSNFEKLCKLKWRPKEMTGNNSKL